MKDVHAPVDAIAVERDLITAIERYDAEILVEEDGFQTFSVGNVEKYRNLVTEL